MGAETQPARASRWIEVLALALLLAGILAVALADLDRITYYLRADEGTYLAYAERVRVQGLGAFPGLFREYVATEERWILPSPLRLGYIATSAGWAALFGLTPGALSGLSLASHLALVALSAWFVRRWRGPWAAFAVAAWLGFSALHLGLGRRALLDSHAALWQAGSAWLLLAALAEPDRRAWRVAFVPVFAWTILVKEASVLWTVPFVGAFLVEKLSGRTPLRWRSAAVLLGLPLLLAGGVYVLAAGGLTPLLDTVHVVRDSLARNVWAQRNLAGPWYRYVVDAVLLSPWLTLFGLMGLGLVLLRAREAGAALDLERRCAWILVLGIATLAWVEKDVRYAMALFVPLVLLAWSWLDAVLARGFAAQRRWILVGVVLLVAWSEVATYRTLFVEHGVYDPISGILGHLRGLFDASRP